MLKELMPVILTLAVLKFANAITAGWWTLLGFTLLAYLIYLGVAIVLAFFIWLIRDPF